MNGCAIRWIAIGTLALGLQSCATPPNVTPILVTSTLSNAGVDDHRNAFATSFLQELRRSGDGSDVGQWLLLGRVAATAARPPPAEKLRGSTVVLIAPGIFGDCVASQTLPFSDGVARAGTENYSAGYKVYERLGLRRIEAAQLKGRASSARNGQLLVDKLTEYEKDVEVQNVVLIGYSKGVADSLHAIQQLESEAVPPKKLKAFVSVAGVVNGTTLADQNQLAYETLTRHFNPLECSPSEGGEMESLTKRVRTAWMESFIPPKRVRMYSIVASTDANQVAPGLALTHRKLSTLGDYNDGQVLVSDAILPKSALLAVVKSDHWAFVLPLKTNPSLAVRAAAGSRDFPRGSLFAAIVNFVVGDIAPD